MEASACAWQVCSAVLAFFSAGAAMAAVAESSSEKMTINRIVSSRLNMPRRRPAVVDEDGILARFGEARALAANRHAVQKNAQQRNEVPPSQIEHAASSPGATAIIDRPAAAPA